jgi:hypothetical protein
MINITSRLEFIFYITCEISQKFCVFTFNFKFSYKQTPDDDRDDRNMWCLKNNNTGCVRRNTQCYLCKKRLALNYKNVLLITIDRLKTGVHPTSETSCTPTLQITAPQLLFHRPAIQ